MMQHIGEKRFFGLAVLSCGARHSVTDHFLLAAIYLSNAHYPSTAIYLSRVHYLLSAMYLSDVRAI